MNIQNLLELVDARWHKEFLVFIETGDASADFLAFLNKDQNCQKAVEKAFNAQAADFEGFAQALAADVERSPSNREQDNVSASLAMALAGALDLSPDQRHVVARRAAEAVLSQSGQSGQKQEIEAVLGDFSEEVATMGS